MEKELRYQTQEKKAKTQMGVNSVFNKSSPIKIVSGNGAGESPHVANT
jgi:hypothetical protein